MSPLGEVAVHTNASEALDVIRHSIPRETEYEANVFLPHLVELAQLETSTYSGHTFWITCHEQHCAGQRRLAIVLACTRDTALHLNYPLYIYIPSTITSTSLIESLLNLVVIKLAETTSVSRVFSVFAPSVAAQTFASLWSSRTGASPIKKPFYHASLGWCSSASLCRTFLTPKEGHAIRAVGLDDLLCFAALCKGFSDDSEYYNLTEEASVRLGRALILKGGVWGYYVDDDRLVSFVACSRITTHCSTITKVFTEPNHRNKGYAKRLVTAVCSYWLDVIGKDWVALFVARDNPSARAVYTSIGFQGLNCDDKQQLDWMEIGFDNTELGWW